jgi:4-hydroxybenzoate polyprenyltransferase
MNKRIPPLCVDLDGTLIASDTLWESVLVLLRRSPWLCFLLPIWLMRGRSFLKSKVTHHVKLAVETLPYRPDVLAFLRQQKAQGRYLVLATAADIRIAEAVAKHLGLFDEVLGSDKNTNLKGIIKRDRLQLLYGEFDYMGDSLSDLPVLAAATRCFLVAPSPALRQRCQGTVAGEFAAIPLEKMQIIKLLRPHQWLKNVLVFVPLLLSDHNGSLEKWLMVLLAAFCFSLMASAGYVVNDLLDLTADRQHATKKYRPFASGALPIQYGLPIFLGLVLISSGISAVFLAWEFLGILWLYLSLTLFYSFYLKRRLVLDVIVLAGLYTHRLFAGGVAVGIATTSWLLAFSLFLFMSLAFLKRYIELAQLPKKTKVSRRGYQADDLPMVMNFGTVSAYLSVLVFALYIYSQDKMAHYQDPFWLWLLCPLWLYGLTRFWFLAHRQNIHDDPVQFVIQDRVSWLIIIFTLLLFGLAK